MAPFTKPSKWQRKNKRRRRESDRLGQSSRIVNEVGVLAEVVMRVARSVLTRLVPDRLQQCWGDLFGDIGLYDVPLLYILEAFDADPAFKALFHL